MPTLPLLTTLLLHLLTLLPTLAFPTGSGICIADANQIANAGGGAMGQPHNYTYTLTPSSKTFTPSSTPKPINITLSGPYPFRGILLYAASNISSATHIGTLTNIDTKKYQPMNGGSDSGVADCSSFGTNATLTHVSSQDKAVNATFQWVPPQQAPEGGNVTFFAVVVAEPDENVGFQVVQSESVSAYTGDKGKRRRRRRVVFM
ncbi:hypothetical protein HDV00_003531 [Rhizophlyctis rosea]|nr:hypothetical protein HDV00_003531 [Rhizophlyctis rosea]